MISFYLVNVYLLALATVALRTQNLKIRGNALSPFVDRHNMINLKPNFIWHVLSTNLARVVVPLHDLLPQSFGHQPSLLLAVILLQRRFKANLRQPFMPILKPRPIYCQQAICDRDHISFPHIVPLAISGLIARCNKPKCTLVIQHGQILLPTIFLQLARLKKDFLFLFPRLDATKMMIQAKPIFGIAQKAVYTLTDVDISLAGHIKFFLEIWVTERIF